MKHKVFAILIGCFFVQALNICRVISMFHLGYWNHKVFEWFHLYLQPVLIIPAATAGKQIALDQHAPCLVFHRLLNGVVDRL